MHTLFSDDGSVVVLSSSGLGSDTDLWWVLAGVCRTLGYVGIVVLAGFAVFTAWIWPGMRHVTRARDLAGAGAALCALTTVATPYAVAGGHSPELSARQLTLSAVRVGLSLVAAGVLLVPRRALGPLRATRLATTLGGSALILTYVLMSDAWGGPLAVVKVVATFAHIGATVAWLGGLAALILVVLPVRGVRGMSRCFGRFSPLAATCVGVLVVSGTVHAWIVLAEHDVAVPRQFVLALLVKTAIVGLMLLLGNIGRVHHQRVRRQRPLSAHNEGVLAAGIGGELVCGAVVLVATAVLVSVA